MEAEVWVKSPSSFSHLPHILQAEKKLGTVSSAAVCEQGQGFQVGLWTATGEEACRLQKSLFIRLWLWNKQALTKQ